LSAPLLTLFVWALGIWTGALAVGELALFLLRRRLGRDPAWRATRTLAPLVDLMGTWAGAAAVLALLLGRQGYAFAWAAALFSVAVMLAASLYHRAVLLPSLDAAWKRLGAGDDPAKWEAEWRALWRIAQGIRLGTLVLALAAFGCGLAM
jgi:hypothetical protein